MKPEEILAAKAVIDLAKSARSAAFDKEPRETEAEDFVAKNPITNFVPDALRVLREVNSILQRELGQ